VLSSQDALDLGCVGPVLRASGVAQDMRALGYAAYQELQMEPVTRTEGDSLARCAVRCEELLQSISLIRQALGKIPAGDIAVKVTGNPNGEVIMRTEQPRGEVVYCLQATGAKNLQRFRVRTPTFANLPAMVQLLQGCDLADVPVLVLTIDPCISCTER
jgi:ech hydrogenase subunit E